MYCVIMAGGVGTRFWPRSREGKSKQFLRILGNKSLIQSTLDRFKPLTSLKNVYVVGNQLQAEALKEHVPEVESENILLEPMGKNTAPCIGLAALFVQQRDPDGVMVVSPADHLIQKEAIFRKTIKAAVKLAAERDVLVTVGIPPDRPATGYGYIQLDEKIGSTGGVEAYRVKTFAEKPNLATAQRFCKSGDFLWNSGIFIWRVSSLMRTLEEFLPNLYDSLMEIQKYLDKRQYGDVLQRVYRQIRSISIDYGVMEKAKNVCVVKGNFLWNDLGSWEQVYKLSSKDKSGNASVGDTVLIDTKDSYVYSSKGVVAVVGIENVVVVQEGGATLVCKREKAEEVRQVVDRLRRKKLLKYV